MLWWWPKTWLRKKEAKGTSTTIPCASRPQLHTGDEFRHWVERGCVYLVNGFSQHLPHKLKQLQVVLVNVGRRWRIKPFISTGSLQKFNRADRKLLASFICCHFCYGDFCGHLASFWHTLNRLSAGLNTFLMISSRNSLNTPSWSIPASSTPRSLTNFTRMTPFMEFAGNRRSWSYPSLEQQIQVLLWGEF